VSVSIAIVIVIVCYKIHVKTPQNRYAAVNANTWEFSSRVILNRTVGCLDANSNLSLEMIMAWQKDW
jgi:hypothetical protein